MSERVYSSEPGSAGVTHYRTGISAFRRLSGRAIIAGTLGAIAIQLLLTLLGLAIGMLALDPAAPGQTGAQGVAIGAVIWGMLSMIIALFCGGWIAGWGAGAGEKGHGLIHGFLTWSTMTVFSFLVIGTAMGGVIGGAAALTGDALGVGTERVDDPAALVDRARDAASGLQGEELELQAREIGDDVSTVGAAAFFWAFLTLLLGAAAATWAGQKGAACAVRRAGTIEGRVEPGRV